MGDIDYKQCEKDFWEMFRNLPPLEKAKVWGRVKEINDFWERIHSVNPEHLILSFEESEKLCKETRKKMLSK